MATKNPGHEYVGTIHPHILTKLYVVNTFYIDTIYYTIYFFFAEWIKKVDKNI